MSTAADVNRAEADRKAVQAWLVDFNADPCRPALRGALFMGRLIRPLQQDRKTVTRRLVTGTARQWLEPDGFTPEFVACRENHLCRYGYPGDVLAVRETWADLRGMGFHGTPFAWRAESLGWDGAEDADAKRARLDYGVKWRPSIFMPMEACRLLLRVTSVGIERLQAITAEEVLAEGVALPDMLTPPLKPDELLALFAQGWDGMHKPGSGSSWAENPWVWRIGLSRIPLEAPCPATT